MMETLKSIYEMFLLAWMLGVIIYVAIQIIKQLKK